MASAGGATLYSDSEQLPPAVLHRRSANYQPKTWDYDSICSMQYANKPSKQTSSVETSLKHRVRQLLLTEGQELASRLRIIGQLQSLGVAYHFEEEITGILMSMHVHDAHLQLKHDLSSTALLFRMLRAHGIPASIEILSAFLDGAGDLEATNPSLDRDGLVALYEASYLAFPGEAMLDRARAFAIEKLQELIPSMKPYQREKVRGVLLDLPLHWRAPRLQAVRSLKEHRGDRNIDPSILQLAALDFNQVQAVHRSELLEMTRWWKETGLREKLPFARDRLVECFFCAACIAPEPRLAGCREVLAKVGSLIVHLDDVYDLYGTLDELATFTDAVGAWDVSSSAAAAALPEYMKAMYSAIRSTSTAAADRVMKEQGYDVLPLYKNAWHELCKAFLVEAKWQHGRTMPSLDEYLDNGWITSTGPLLLLHALTMLPHTQRQQQDSWLRDRGDDGSKDMVYPRLVELCSMVFRLCNDCATHEAESERGEGPSFIACHMAEAGGGRSEEEARGAVADAVAETLKEVNREVAFGSMGAADRLCVNLARIIQCIYRDGDGITSPTDSRKRLVKYLLFTPADSDIYDALDELYSDD
uniref:Uncharacterized protein n=4 Tax=Avena sativa TaxID=4498 RepID=A0ACD5TM43_AVESA